MGWEEGGVMVDSPWWFVYAAWAGWLFQAALRRDSAVWGGAGFIGMAVTALLWWASEHVRLT